MKKSGCVLWAGKYGELFWTEIVEFVDESDSPLQKYGVGDKWP
jgi:hypothetical protein